MRNGFERDRDQIDEDQENEKAVNGFAGAIAYGPLFQHLVNAPAQILDALACHDAEPLS